MLYYRKSITILLYIFLALFFVGPFIHVKADRMTTIYDQLSRVNYNTASNHSIFIVTANGVNAGGTLTVTLPIAFTFGGSYNYTDVELSEGSTNNCETATYTNKTLNTSASGTTWGVSLSVNPGVSTSVIFTSGTDTLSSSKCIRIRLNSNGAGHTLVNPNVTSNTVYQLTVETTSDKGELAIIILGDASVNNVDQVTFNANIATSILMDIDTVTTDCNNTTQTNPANQVINFGTLYPGILQTSGPVIPYICIQAGTNSVNGMRILVQSSRANTIGGLVSGANVIASATANLNSANSGYGLRVSSIGTPTVGTFTTSSPFNSSTIGDVGQISGSLGTASQIITSSGTVRSGASSRIAIELSAKTDTTIPASTTYSDTLTFTAFTNL